MLTRFILIRCLKVIQDAGQFFVVATVPQRRQGASGPPPHMLLIAAPNQALEQPEMPRTFPRSPSGDAPWRRTLLILSLAGTTRWMKLAGVGG